MIETKNEKRKKASKAPVAISHFLFSSTQPFDDAATALLMLKVLLNVNEIPFSARLIIFETR